MYFYGSNLGPLATGHLGPLDLHLNKFVRGELGNATYQISNNWPSGSEVEDFSIYFYDLNLGPLALGHLGPWDLHLNKIGKGPQGNATD